LPTGCVFRRADDPDRGVLENWPFHRAGVCTMSHENPQNTGQVDVRGPRFAAWVTTAVLVVVLIAAAFSTGAATVLIALPAPANS
jgi:hypothetical protein